MDFKERLVNEQKELDDKIQKLLDFINSDKFLELEKKQGQLLIQQAFCMDSYNCILKERIELLNN